jgi:acetyl-CoA synthetase
MITSELFKYIRALIAEKRSEELNDLSIVKPVMFNWVKEVFELINFREHPDASALVWTDGFKTTTYSFKEILLISNQMLNFLRKNGARQKDVIFSQIPLLPVNWLCYLVAIKGGFQLVPAAAMLDVQDIVYRFTKVKPKIVMASLDNCDQIEKAEEITGQHIPIKIAVDGAKPGWMSLEAIYDESTEAETAETAADDSLFLFFTSGTTGMPKVVKHTHLSYPLGHLTTASWIGLKHGDIHYNISQPGWAKFAWSSVFAPWSMGATVFAFDPKGRFNAKHNLSVIEKFKVTTLCCPPTVLRLFIQEDINSYQLSLRECVSAGEPLNPEIIDRWQKGTGLNVRDGYGQTESTCIVANLPQDRLKFGSMGKPTFLYDVVIADEAGNSLPDNEEGALAIRMNPGTPNGIFSGYLDSPEKKNEVYKNGLYYTGDRAYRDDEGYIWFVSRDDDLIKSSDYRIGPFEVESVVQKHDCVLESAVIGSPHKLKGYEVKAFIILAPGYQGGEILADELFEFTRENLAPYKMPRIIEFVSELPKTISGKIKRGELRSREMADKINNSRGNLEFFYKRKN